MYPTRFTNLPEARARFGDRVDRVGAFLSEVDDLADAVVTRIEAMPRGRGWALFTEAAARGAESVADLPEEMRAIFREVERVPAWVDWTTLDRGGEVLLRAGLLGGLVLGLCSLPLGYASPGGNKPLVFSGRLQEQAPMRLNETARFVQAVCRPGGMRPRADGYQITLRVRLMHAQVRRMILRTGRWDLGAWGAPINQHDMAATTLLFSLVFLRGLRALGVRVTPDDGEEYMQLWRYVAHVIGVRAELASATEAEGTRLAELIRATQGPPDDDARALTRALLRGPLETVKSERARKNIERRIELSKALCRELLGEEVADALGVERTKMRIAVPVLKRVVGVAERLRESVSVMDRTALVTGTRYWDRVVEIGLAGATAEFGLPERLAAA